MSAIASVLATMGHRVSGSDLKESAGLERLRAEGVEVFIGHRAENLRDDLDYVTISTAIPDRNREVVDGARTRAAGLAPRRHARGDRSDATHGRDRRDARQDDHLVDARVGAGPGRLASRRSSSVAT